MDAIALAQVEADTPPPLTLQDLDREELLHLVARSNFYRPRDLWGVRWKVLSDRASAAGDGAQATAEAYDRAAAEVRDLRGKPGKGAALSTALKRQDTAWKVYQCAWAKSERADHASERAWKALCACDGQVAP